MILRKMVLLSTLAGMALVLSGCRGNDAEPGKVVVTATRKLGKQDIVSTPRPK